MEWSWGFGRVESVGNRLDGDNSSVYEFVLCLPDISVGRSGNFGHADSRRH